MHDKTDQIRQRSRRDQDLLFGSVLKTGEHAVIKRATSVSFGDHISPSDHIIIMTEQAVLSTEDGRKQSPLSAI
eukprot:scaffold1911_cov114-Skeletonema_dohrnii-CCMP3373.AAC.4